jgi:hypothetical protein
MTLTRAALKSDRDDRAPLSARGAERPAAAGPPPPLDGPLLVVHGHREGSAADGNLRISQECVSRVHRALQFARAKRVGAVLMCGGGVPGFPSEARQMAVLWDLPDVPVYVEEQSTDTAENTREALHWASLLGATELVVVSS